MPPSAPQLFTGVTPDQYARLVDKARAAGIDLNGNSGTASKLGIEVAWNYDPARQELTIQCLRTPPFMKTATVDARIQSLVREIQA